MNTTGCSECGSLVGGPGHKCAAQEHCAFCGQAADLYIPNPQQFGFSGAAQASLSAEMSMSPYDLARAALFWSDEDEVAICSRCLQTRIVADAAPQNLQ
jgi:hypothetical protein